MAGSDDASRSISSTLHPVLVPQPMAASVFLVTTPRVIDIETDRAGHRLWLTPTVLVDDHG